MAARDGSIVAINYAGYTKNEGPFALTDMPSEAFTPGVVYGLMKRTAINPGPIQKRKEAVENHGLSFFEYGASAR